MFDLLARQNDESKRVAGPPAIVRTCIPTEHYLLDVQGYGRLSVYFQLVSHTGLLFYSVCIGRMSRHPPKPSGGGVEPLTLHDAIGFGRQDKNIPRSSLTKKTPDIAAEGKKDRYGKSGQVTKWRKGVNP